MRRRNLQCGILLGLVAACFLSLSGEAVELRGRVTSSLYGSERSNEAYWRSYIGFNSTATLWRQGRTRSLGLHTNLRWTGDLATKESGGPQTYIYDLHLRLKGYPDRSTIYVGRQFVYNTLGSALIDGLRTRVRLLKSVSLDLFGGARVLHETPDKVQSLGKYGFFGSRVEYRRGQSLRVALNWFGQRSNGSISSNRVGVDAWRTIRRTELYGRVSYDLLDLDLAGVLTRVSARPDKWYLSAEFHWRKPSVTGNTVFGLIEAEAYKGLRTEVTRVLWRDIRGLVQVHRELIEGDDVSRFMVGLRTSRFMIAWHNRSGYGGESDGLQGRASWDLKPNLELYGSTFVSRYKIQPETVGKIDAYSSSTGLLWRPGRAMQIRVEAQYLKNAVDDSNYRLFIRLAKRFEVKPAKTEVGQ